MKYQYCSNITFIKFQTDIARFLQYFINLSNSFINILAIWQDFSEIFSKYSLNITVLCRITIDSDYYTRINIVFSFLTRGNFIHSWELIFFVSSEVTPMNHIFFLTSNPRLSKRSSITLKALLTPSKSHPSQP